MGFVNADSSAILEAWQSITNAASSVEAAKKSISQKYKQLGNDWNDKKYRELGDVVRDCTQALNSILRILQQAEKPVSLLISSLQEYEETALNGFASDRSAVPQTGALHDRVLVKKKTDAVKKRPPAGASPQADGYPKEGFYGSCERRVCRCARRFESNYKRGFKR